MGADYLEQDVALTQSLMMISPAMWRRFIKPRMARFIAELKAVNPKVKVAYHSDGVINPIIPELIEIGVDVLNPIHTLPFGSSDDVRAEVAPVWRPGQGRGPGSGPRPPRPA